MIIGTSSRFPTQIKVRIFEVGTGLSEAFNVMCVEVGNGLHNTDKLVTIGIHFEKLIVKIEPKTFKCRLVHMVITKLTKNSGRKITLTLSLGFQTNVSRPLKSSRRV